MANGDDQPPSLTPLDDSQRPAGMPPNYGISHDYSTGKVTYGELPRVSDTAPPQQQRQKNPAQEGVAKVLSNMFMQHADAGDADRLKYEQGVARQVAMWEKVYFTTKDPEERKDAAKQLDKLKHLKPTDAGSYQGGVAKVLDTLGQMAQTKKGQTTTYQVPGTNVGDAEFPAENKSVSLAPQQRGGIAKVGGGILRGLGAAANVAGHGAGALANAEAHKYGRPDVVNMHKQMQYPELPSLDPNFGAGSQEREAQAEGRAKVAEATEILKRPLTEQERAQIAGVAPKQKLATRKVADKNSPTGFSYVTVDELSGQEVSRMMGAPATGASEGRPAVMLKDGKPISVLLDKNTNQVIPGSENSSVIDPRLLPNLREGVYHYVDENGMIHEIKSTTSSQKQIPGATGGGGKSSTPKKELSGKIGEGASAAPLAKGDRVIGHKASQADTMVQRDAVKAADKIRPMVTLMNSANDYYEKATTGKGKFDSAGDLSLVVNAVRAMNPGSVRLPNLEITLERERGTLEQRVERWFQKNTVDGTLPKEYRDELMGVIRRETTQAATEAAGNWGVAFKKSDGTLQKPVPYHLQPFFKADSLTPLEKPVKKNPYED